MQRNKDLKKAEWYKVRQKVFKLDHYECVRCNHVFFNSGEPKKITKATLVHHIFPRKEYPQYKYSIYVKGQRNLVSLCNDCHEIIEGRKWGYSEKKFFNEERFD